MIDEFKQNIRHGAWWQHGNGLKKVERPRRLRLRIELHSKRDAVIAVAHLCNRDALFLAAWQRI